MTGLTPYLLLPGDARAALEFYGEVFGGSAELHDFAEFGRTDGPPDAIAHGELVGGGIALFAADATADEQPFQAQGLFFSLLGAADAATSRDWFGQLAHGGTVVDDLQQRPWGAFDGRVVDRFGVQWLIGFESDD